MSDQGTILMLIFTSIIGTVLYISWEQHKQNECLKLINSLPIQQPTTPQSQPQYPPPCEILVPTLKERLASRQQAIELTMRALDAKITDIKTYLDTKSLAFQSQTLHKARAEQEYWKCYDNSKRIANNQAKAPIKRLPEPRPQDLLNDFGTEYEGSEVVQPAMSRVERWRREIGLGTGVPWVPETQRERYPFPFGGEREGGVLGSRG